MQAVVTKIAVAPSGCRHAIVFAAFFDDSKLKRLLSPSHDGFLFLESFEVTTSTEIRSKSRIVRPTNDVLPP